MAPAVTGTLASSTSAPTFVTEGTLLANLISNSEEIDQWSLINLTVSTEGTPGPADYGRSTADRLTETTAFGQHAISNRLYQPASPLPDRSS
jgi:hypothetical protein